MNYIYIQYLVVITKHITNKHKHVSRTKTKHDTYTYPINLYAKNMRFMVDNVIIKSLLSELSNSLNETQWLKVSKDKYKPINHIEELRNKLRNKLKDELKDEKQDEKQDEKKDEKQDETKYEKKINDIINKNHSSKPYGSYYSKGGWLFHEDACCSIDDEIILVEVNYDTIYRITGKNPDSSPIKNTVYKKSLKTFVDKYGKMIGKDKCVSLYKIEDPFCSWETKEKFCKHRDSCLWKNSKCINNVKKINEDKKTCSKIKTSRTCKTKKNREIHNCIWEEEFNIYNWGALYNEKSGYDGFCIYPYPEIELIKKFKKQTSSFLSYDAETLCLWNHKPVIKHHNLGTIREIIHNAGIKGKLTKHYNEYLHKFIPKLIEKIKSLNA